MQVTGIGWAGTRTDAYGAMVAFCTGVLGLTREHEEPDFAVLGLPSGGRLMVDPGASDAYWPNGLKWALRTAEMLKDFNVGWFGTDRDCNLFGGHCDPAKKGLTVAANFDWDNDPTFGVGGVPEPASWALMIMGFGAAGATLRRRRILMA